MQILVNEDSNSGQVGENFLRMTGKKSPRRAQVQTVPAGNRRSPGGMYLRETLELTGYLMPLTIKKTIVKDY